MLEKEWIMQFLHDKKEGLRDYSDLTAKQRYLLSRYFRGRRGLPGSTPITKVKQ